MNHSYAFSSAKEQSLKLTMKNGQEQSLKLKKNRAKATRKDNRHISYSEQVTKYNDKKNTPNDE
jgi:hypothetical protein